MNNFLLSSPLLHSHFEKTYHTSATGHEEVETGGSQFVLG